MQESPIGSIVFQALAIDPDDPATPNGRLTYKFLDEGTLGSDHAFFEIRKFIMDPYIYYFFKFNCISLRSSYWSCNYKSSSRS